MLKTINIRGNEYVQVCERIRAVWRQLEFPLMTIRIPYA